MKNEKQYNTELYNKILKLADYLTNIQVFGGPVNQSNFCKCQKPWGVNGRCAACGMPIKIN